MFKSNVGDGGLIFYDIGSIKCYEKKCLVRIIKGKEFTLLIQIRKGCFLYVHILTILFWKPNFHRLA